MKQYIDKSVVVAEIERLIFVCDSVLFDNDASKLAKDRYEAKKVAYNNILSFINTLEMKEVDLENCIICKVDWYDGFLLDYTQEQQDKLLEKIGANVGDKIKVILIKEE